MSVSLNTVSCSGVIDADHEVPYLCIMTQRVETSRYLQGNLSGKEHDKVSRIMQTYKCLQNFMLRDIKLNSNDRFGVHRGENICSVI
jgi:hypothetical protein